MATVDAPERSSTATLVRSKVPSQSPCGQGNSRIIVAGGKKLCLWGGGLALCGSTKFSVILICSTSGKA